MIFNNYKAMMFIRDISQEDLTPELILELQRIVTDGTLDDFSGAGRWRLASEDIKVVDPRDDTILHEPPDASEIPERVALLCEFANGKFEQTFIHPVWRAILLHMMLGYDHPFIDGNGRTARALFYWSMAHQGYWLMEFVTISKILRNAPAQYARAYLFVTSDDNDTTYFIHYHLRILIRAIGSLYEYLSDKINEIRKTEDLIRQSDALINMMNRRQLALVTHALKHPGTTYEIQAHRKSHNITYETARTDLLALEKVGILSKSRPGRAYIFTAPKDLHDRLEALSLPKAQRELSRRRRGVIGA
jgi:Fic family protein